MPNTPSTDRSAAHETQLLYYIPIPKYGIVNRGVLLKAGVRYYEASGRNLQLINYEIFRIAVLFVDARRLLYQIIFGFSQIFRFNPDLLRDLKITQ